MIFPWKPPFIYIYYIIFIGDFHRFPSYIATFDYRRVVRIWDILEPQIRFGDRRIRSPGGFGSVFHGSMNGRPWGGLMILWKQWLLSAFFRYCSIEVADGLIFNDYLISREIIIEPIVRCFFLTRSWTIMLQITSKCLQLVPFMVSDDSSMVWRG